MVDNSQKNSIYVSVLRRTNNTMTHITLRLFIAGFLSCMILQTNAQENSDFDRNYIGGTLGLQFGTYTGIQSSLHYGFHITEKFSIGIGGVYQFFRTKSYGFDERITIFGGNAFARFDIIEALFLHGEYEMLSYETDMFSPTREMENIFAEGVLLGAGYRQFFSIYSNSNVYMMILYNFNQTIYTPYFNPVFRMGMEIYF
jgi:hypothetical protein